MVTYEKILVKSYLSRYTHFMTTTQEHLNVYIESLLKKRGFDKLTPEFEKELKERMFEEIARRIGLMVLQELSEEELKKYAELAKKSANPLSDPELVLFIRNSVLDFPEKFKMVLQSYTKDFLAQKI